MVRATHVTSGGKALRHTFTLGCRQGIISDVQRNDMIPCLGKMGGLQLRDFSNSQCNAYLNTMMIMMNAVLGPVCTDEAIFGPGATWVNEANFFL
jgi:hypothetical protein